MASLAPLGPEFQPFLQSKLWEEKNETRLTVLSALARLDIDPWLEAAELAALPKVGAEKRLADRLGKLPGAPSAPLDVDTFCGRSVSLLPQPQERAKGVSGPSTGTRAQLFGLASAYVLVGAWIAVVYMHNAAAPAAPKTGEAVASTIHQMPPPPSFDAAKP